MSEIKDKATLADYVQHPNWTTVEFRPLKNRTQTFHETLLDQVCSQLPWLTELTIVESSISSIPPSIQQLSSLTKLRIRNCPNLTSIPPSIAALNSLTHLWIDESAMTQLPDTIGDLSALTSLAIDHSPVTIIPSLEGLVNLDYIHITKTHLESMPLLPPSIRRIYLSDNALTTLSDQLPHLLRLEHLDVTKNRLTHLPASFGDLVHHEVLKTLEVRPQQSDYKWSAKASTTIAAVNRKVKENHKRDFERQMEEKWGHQ